MSPAIIFNVIILVGWLSLSVWLGLGVATLGNQEAMLMRDRGQQRIQQREYNHRRDQLRTVLNAEARRDRLELAVRELALPLAPPPTRSTDLGPVQVALGRERISP